MANKIVYSPFRHMGVKLLFLSGIAMLLIGFTLLNKNVDSSGKSKFVPMFSDMVVATDKALLEFGEVDTRYISGLATDEEYGAAWLKLKSDLDSINSPLGKLDNPPAELKGLVNDYKTGLSQIISVASDVAKYLTSDTVPSSTIENDRDKFEAGLNLLRDVRSKLKPIDEAI